MELDGVAGLSVCDSLRPQQGAKSFENSNCSTTIVIGAGCSQNGRQEQVDAILVGTEDDGVIRLTGNAGDNTELTPGVIEALDGCAVVAGARLLHCGSHLVE